MSSYDEIDEALFKLWRDYSAYPDAMCMLGSTIKRVARECGAVEPNVEDERMYWVTERGIIPVSDEDDQ